MKKQIFLLFILAVTFYVATANAQTQIKQAKPIVQTTAPSARITFRSGERPGILCISNRLVLDEALIDGRFVTRYWNPNGQIWPEMHFAGLKWAADQPAESFRLSINKKDLSGGYEWQGSELTPDPSSWRVRCDASGKPLPVVHSVVTLLNKQAGIQVKVHTRLDGSPFMIRWLEITNLNQTAVAITEVAPFAGLLWKHRNNEHLPKDFASPFEVAYTHSFEWGQEGDFYFSDLTDGKMAVDGGKKGRSGWGRPAFWARNRCNGQTFVCELAWGGNYEFAFDSRISNPNDASLFFKMGLSGYDEALRVLDAGETISTPSVHMALFQDNDDAIVQATHDHVRNVVMPKQIPGRQVEIEANHRGYLCDRENVADIIKDIDVTKSVGVEMYVIDAGWYGKEPNLWWDNAGDWFDGKWMEKGGGMKAISDYAHQKGMKFGLWVEIEAAGVKTDLKKNHPDWLLKRDGQPIVGGRALDITNPEVMKFEKESVERLVRDLKLDMYRIDHNHCLTPAPNRQYKGFTEDLLWRYYDNFYKMFDGLRVEFPNLVFQNCAGGGGRLDWGTMARFHNVELSDCMRLPRGFKILNGVSMSLPPEILLRTFGTESGEQVLDGDVDTQLRHNFCRMIFRGIAPSLGDLSPYLKERVLNYVKIYKDVIRPTMINGKVFHHTPMLPIMEASPWCVLEYAKPDCTTSVAVIMRTSSEKVGTDPDEYLFRPRGIDPSASYNVLLDSRGLSYKAPGELLMREGIKIRLEEPLTSELVILQQK
jgi:alpha-galactosidase